MRSTTAWHDGRGRNGSQHNSCGRPIKLIATGRVERGIFGEVSKIPRSGRGAVRAAPFFICRLSSRDPLGIRVGNAARGRNLHANRTRDPMLVTAACCLWGLAALLLI